MGPGLFSIFKLGGLQNMAKSFVKFVKRFFSILISNGIEFIAVFKNHYSVIKLNASSFTPCSM